MDVTVIYPKGQFGSKVEERFEVQLDELPVDETTPALLERLYRIMNNVDGSDFELPLKLGCRSMSMGDIALIEGEFWMVATSGFKKIPDHQEGQEYEWEFVYSMED